MVIGDFTNEISIGSKTDKIDLSAINGLKLADLNFQNFHNGANTIGEDADDSVMITANAYEGSIVLTGVLTSNLSANNFIFSA